MGLTNPLHIAFVLVLLLIVFGAKRLPETGRSLGSGMRGFRDSLTGEGEPPQQEHPEEAPDATPGTPALTSMGRPPTPAA